MSPADQLLEEQIHEACQRGMTANDPDTQRAAFAAMGELISKRSPERVVAMELDRGLRVP